jgi:DNA polymerase-1
MPPRSDKIAVPYIQALLKAMHILLLKLKALKHDLIGTIAKQAEKKTTKSLW